MDMNATHPLPLWFHQSQNKGPFLEVKPPEKGIWSHLQCKENRRKGSTHERDGLEGRPVSTIVGK